MTRLLVLFVSLAVCALAGCGRGISVPATVPVTGTVLIKGKAVGGVLVTFHPQFDIGAVKFTPSALTDPAGKFVLRTGSAAGDGAPVGKYAVTFSYPVVETDRKHGNVEVEIDAWKGKYNDPAASKWKVEVRPGENPLEPFRLD